MIEGEDLVVEFGFVRRAFACGSVEFEQVFCCGLALLRVGV